MVVGLLAAVLAAGACRATARAYRVAVGSLLRRASVRVFAPTRPRGCLALRDARTSKA